MSKFAWTIHFSGNDGLNGGFVKQIVKNAMFDLRFNKDRRSWAQQTPTSIRWKEQPAKERRRLRIDKARQMVRWEAQSLITQILAKNQIKNPPSSLKDIRDRIGQIPNK